MTVDSGTDSGRLIAIEGIDGAGKSTLTATLRRELDARGIPVLLADKHSTEVAGDGLMTEYLTAVNAVVYKRKAEVGPVCGERYWLHALAAWYSLVDEVLIRPAVRQGQVVLMDNSYGKIIARYATDPAFSTSFVRETFSHLRPPDLVLQLDLPAKTALQRKKEFTALEAGRSGDSAADFVAYQDKVTAALHGLAVSDRWLRIDVTDHGPEEVLELALAGIAERLPDVLAGSLPQSSSR